MKKASGALLTNDNQVKISKTSKNADLRDSFSTNWIFLERTPADLQEATPEELQKNSSSNSSSNSSRTPAESPEKLQQKLRQILIYNVSFLLLKISDWKFASVVLRLSLNRTCNSLCFNNRHQNLWLLIITEHSVKTWWKYFRKEEFDWYLTNWALLKIVDFFQNWPLSQRSFVFRAENANQMSCNYGFQISKLTNYQFDLLTEKLRSFTRCKISISIFDSYQLFGFSDTCV